MTLVALLLVIGISLLVLDIAFIPGMFVGIIGALLIASSVLVAYTTIGHIAGHITLAIALLASGIILYWFIKTDVWSKLALKDTHTAKVNEEDAIALTTGDEGFTISALRPSGKASIKDHFVEVISRNGYCDANKKIKIIRIDNKRIYVEEI